MPSLFIVTRDPEINYAVYKARVEQLLSVHAFYLITTVFGKIARSFSI